MKKQDDLAFYVGENAWHKDEQTRVLYMGKNGKMIARILSIPKNSLGNRYECGVFGTHRSVYFEAQNLDDAMREVAKEMESIKMTFGEYAF